MWAERKDWHAFAVTVAVCLVALAASIMGVYLLEERAGVRDASTVFLLAVALVAYLRGSWAAVATALGAFLAYNYLFLLLNSPSSSPTRSTSSPWRCSWRWGSPSGGSPACSGIRPDAQSVVSTRRGRSSR